MNDKEYFRIHDDLYMIHGDEVYIFRPNLGKFRRSIFDPESVREFTELTSEQAFSIMISTV